MVAFCILKELCRQSWSSDVVIWAPGVAVEVSLLVGKPLLGAACRVSSIPQMAVLIPDLLHFPKIHLNHVLKHIASLYSLLWMREVAFKSCPWPRTSLDLKKVECAGAGAPLSLWRCCSTEATPELAQGSTWGGLAWVGRREG